MSLESSLREICDGLKSNRITERKKNADSLKEFLNRNAVPSLLSENTLKKRGYSWSDLFDDINEYIFRETEKFETSKTFDNTVRPLCSTILHLCVAGSNKGKAYIKCDKITDACLIILKDGRLKKAIGDAYLNLLYKHVLPYEHYLGFITPQTWEDLLDVSMSACLSTHSKLDDYTQLRLVLLIMKNATNYCQFVTQLRDALPKWKKCFTKVINDKKSQEVVVEIMIVLVDTLSAECRRTLCHFMESVLTYVLKIYDQNLEVKKKSLLFQLLHQIVVLHHPLGKCRSEEGSLADNWSTWIKQLRSILEVICIEINYLQKSQIKAKKTNEDIMKSYSHFYNLSAAVYFQTFSMHETIENEGESSSKRFKASFNKNNCFHDLLNEIQVNAVPWLGIIHVYVKNFGSTLSADNYLYSAEVLDYLLANDNINWQIYQDLARLVLQNHILMNQLSENCDHVFLSLWNSCVRNSASLSASHKAIHTVLQCLIDYNALKHQHAQSLLKLYIEKAMPVTQTSVSTLSKLFYKFFNKMSYDNVRNECLAWLLQGDFASVDTKTVKELLQRLVSNTNLNIKSTNKTNENNLRDIVFDNEKCILFSEFELEVTDDKSNKKHVKESVEVNTEIDKLIREQFKQKIAAFVSKVNNHNELLDFIKVIDIAVSYIDLALKFNLNTSEQMLSDSLFKSIMNALTIIYTAIEKCLKSDALISVKINVIQKLKDIYMEDLEDVIHNEIRSRVHKEFFITINGILVTESVVDDDDVVYEADEREMNSTTLKHWCVLLIAAYCRKTANFREELLNFILDPKIYDFAIDSQCVFKCLDLLNDDSIEEPPYEMLFTLMQYMCRDLYRDPKASLGILINLFKMLDVIWSSETTLKQNCLIMIRSYIMRCQKLHYPPRVAALIYDCVAKIVMLNKRYCLETDPLFETAVMEKVKGDTHSLRLYCCYMLEKFIVSESDTDMHLNELLDIFVIQVTNTQEQIIKDETANRTLTVLHCFLSLAQSKPALFQKLVITILQIQKQKSLSEYLVKKVLKKIATINGIENFDYYVNKNIVSILYFWFMKNNSVEELPVFLLGSESLDVFVDLHKKWLIAADVLWRKDGDLRNWNAFDHIKGEPRQPIDELLETCFPNIIALCLPYLVTEKYHIAFNGSESLERFKKSTASANKMFQLTGEILDNDKWTNLFVENVGELVLLNATYLSDRNEARQMFQVDISDNANAYCYPKNVFMAILEYVGDLTDGNIMQYLCENQPLAIFKVLFILWKNLTDESVFENKVLALHAFITFVETVPLDQISDSFVCNFACKSFVYGIKNCKDSKEIRVLVKAAKIIIERLIPNKVDLIRKSVSQILTILFIKIEEGFEKECKLLFEYLMSMKHYLKDSDDVVDFVTSLSQSASDSIFCSTKSVFIQKLNNHQSSINCSSPETLSNLRKLLECNKHYLKIMYEEMSPKGFSEDCETSIIHQIVHSLNNILKTVQDEKIIIEACNCLSEIGTYDLKTLVTVQPMNTERIVVIYPQQYMTCVVVKSLSEILFDSPTDTSKVSETLCNVLKYKEGINALDLEKVNKEVLSPLSSASENKPINIKINMRKFEQYCTEYYDGIFLKATTDNWYRNNRNYSPTWLKKVTTTLLTLIGSDDNYFNSLLEVCAVKADVCQKILPPLVGLLIQCSNEKHIEVFSRHINNYFNYIWEQSFDERVEYIGDSSQTNLRVGGVLDIGQKTVIQYMLSIVDFIRLQKSFYKARSKRTVEMLNYLGLDYDKVSWAASVADENLAAIYYGELWAVSQNGGVPPPGPEPTTNLPGGENIQHIFRMCYVSIGEMDAIDGCGTAHLTIENEKRKHLINTGQYTDALLLHDIAFSYGNPNDLELQCGAMRSLHKSGMHHLALQYIKSLPENDELNDIKYECLSFLGDWSEIVDTQDLVAKSKADSNPRSILKEFHYACLKDCINTPNITDSDKLTSVLNTAKLTVAKLCQGLNMENCQNVYKVVSKLHLFTDIEDYLSVRTNNITTNELLTKWEVDRLPRYNDFKHLEPLISQRVLMLEHAAKSCDNLKDSIIDLQMQYAKLELSNNKVHMAQRLLALVKKMCSSEEVSLVESEISWAKGHKEIALSLLRNIVSNTSTEVMLTAKSLRQYALWMADSKRDNPRDIIDKYLLKSLQVLDRSDHVETRLKVYYDIARFADAEYKQVVSYMNSSIFENKVKVMESMRGTASSLRSTQHSLTRDERKALVVNERFKELDEVEIANTKAEKKSFLRLAMRYYLLSLKQCEQNNLSIFRVISLWLNNPSFEFEESDNISFEELLLEIPSRKFITVLPQLAPRLTNEDTTFAQNLREIIKKCALEHPHHTLPILFGLKNSEKDKMITNASGAIGGSSQRSKVLEPRVVAAEMLVKELAGTNKQMSLIVSQMEKICDATISFANYKPKAKDAKQRIPDAEKIHKLRNLDAIPIPTVTTAVNENCNYRHFPTLQSFENYFELVGGINCPKKISCLDSTGHKRILLIKGEDDMRQDAVMQQVFTIVNTLLEKNPVTNRNKLLIRTYKVVPMSKQSGVLEWCVGTVPLGVYLVGSSSGNDGAHARYRPQDMSCFAARKLLIDYHKAGKSNKEKLAVFTKILKEFRPVFHYFFTENYLDPVTWYERRLAYTKSVATSSMVGYILGLGDRHVQNILVDKQTAEVIHIDFGIAFDQGKTLQTPETVPFRLTQDMIAGFGSSGVEGIFRRCCEKTMYLLRDNSETLLTILEVLLCDPLYSWTVTSAQQNVASNRNTTLQGSSGVNSGLAERALLAVSSKLSGTEGGVAGGVAVPGQVARLLHSAADPGNLCRLFPGWQPYL